MRVIYLFILSGFVSFSAQARQNEKIHIHFDKDIYLPGETIWFKAYLYNGSTASVLSTNFYTAIYDADGKLLTQKQYPVFNGTVSGDFELADTLITDKVQFVAFTKTMQQTDSNNAYKKIISIYKNNSPEIFSTAPVDNVVYLKFSAEGGNAIEGITNYIVYRAWYKDGEPAQIKGRIIEQGTQTEIDSFYTDNFGMGKLQFIPQVNKVYIAVWTNINRELVSTALPQVSKYGIGFHAEQLGNTLYYSITKNTNAESFNKIKLVAQMGNEEQYSANIEMNKALKAVNTIPLDSFRNGLLQLTLYDANNNLLQQQVVLVNKKEKEPEISILEKSIEPKGKNVIELLVPDTLIYNLSASITDISFVDNKPGIEQNLWFNENLNKLAPKISEAFKENNQKALELIMQTGGWNKYTQPVAEASVKDDFLSITVNYKEKNYALPKNEMLTLIVSDKATGKQFYNLAQATQTSYTKPGLLFYDSARIYFKTNKTKELEKNIFLQVGGQVTMPANIGKAQNTLYENHSIKIKNTVNYDSTLLQQFYTGKPRKFNAERTFKTVTVKSRYKNVITERILELDKKYTSGMFSGIARGYQFNLIDDETVWAQSDVLNYLIYRVGGLSISTKNGERVLIGRTGKKVITFIDETELPEQDGLSNIQVSRIAYIKYIGGIVIGSSFVSNDGALYIYLKKGDEPVISRTPDMQSTTVKGYDLPKEFFNPDYSDKSELLNPDFRATVYWNPYIVTDKANNKIKIEYYNNDISKKLLLTIEGFNEEGKLIHIEKLIEN